MKSSKDDITQRYLLLFKLDAKNTFDRIKTRKKEFVEIFSLRRTREHFPKIFNNKYMTARVEDLAYCSSETISALDQFYTMVDDISWYLYHTEDMPSTVEDNIHRMVIKLQKLHQTLDLYLDAELSIDQETQDKIEDSFGIDEESSHE